MFCLTGIAPAPTALLHCTQSPGCPLARHLVQSPLPRECTRVSEQAYHTTPTHPHYPTLHTPTLTIPHYIFPPSLPHTTHSRLHYPTLHTPTLTTPHYTPTHPPHYPTLHPPTFTIPHYILPPSLPRTTHPPTSLPHSTSSHPHYPTLHPPTLTTPHYILPHLPTYLCCRWSRSVAWARDTVVRWEGEVFRAEGNINVAIPGNTSHEYFYVSRIQTASSCGDPFSPTPSPCTTTPFLPISAGTLPVTGLHIHLAGRLGNRGSADAASGSVQVAPLAPVPLRGRAPLGQLLLVL